jgi:hypothetical protein
MNNRLIFFQHNPQYHGEDGTLGPWLPNRNSSATGSYLKPSTRPSTSFESNNEDNPGRSVEATYDNPPMRSLQTVSNDVESPSSLGYSGLVSRDPEVQHEYSSLSSGGTIPTGSDDTKRSGNDVNAQVDRSYRPSYEIERNGTVHTPGQNVKYTSVVVSNPTDGNVADVNMNDDKERDYFVLQKQEKF